MAVCTLQWTQLASTQFLQRVRFFDNLDRDVDWSNRLVGRNPDKVRAAAAAHIVCLHMSCITGRTHINLAWSGVLPLEKAILAIVGGHWLCQQQFYRKHRGILVDKAL